MKNSLSHLQPVEVVYNDYGLLKTMRDSFFKLYPADLAECEILTVKGIHKVLNLPHYMCDYRGAIPVAGLLPRTFANLNQLVNSKWRWQLVPKPADQFLVDGLSLSVLHQLRYLFLTESGSLITGPGSLRAARSSYRAKRGDGNPSGSGRGARSEHLQVHICELLSVWPSPVYNYKNHTNLSEVWQALNCRLRFFKKDTGEELQNTPTHCCHTR